MWPFKKERKTIIKKSINVKSAWDASEADRLLSGWVTGTTPINSQIESDLRQLRARSRNLAKNDPYLRRFFQLCRANIVGHKGFSFSSDVKRKAGSPDADQLVQAAIEKEWKEFGKPGVACSLDKFSMVDIQNLIVDQLFRDGEAILYQYKGKSENKYGVSFKFIDPELMDVNHKGFNGSGKIRMGIETDSRGRVVAYHLRSTDTAHDNHYQVGGKGYIRIPKNQIIHKFFSEYVDQLRGYPQGASALLRMRYLNGYEEAELVAARTSSATMGFIERGENGLGFEGGVVTDEEGNEIVEEDEEIQADAGSFHYIDKGASIHTWDPAHPTTAYKDYVKGVLRGIASGLGIDYNTLANDLEGVNFSSLRGGVLESRELWKCFQDWMITHIMNDVFERWLTESLLNNAITMPNGTPFSSANLPRYMDYHFQGRRWAWVDPKKDIETATIAVNERFRSRSDIIREQGGDPEQVWEEIKRETKLLETMGITPIVAAMDSEPKIEEAEGVNNEEEN